MKRSRTLFAIVAVLVVVVGAIGLLRTNLDAQPKPTLTRQWPTFTMIYREFDKDPISDRVGTDRTVRLDVVDDFTWRAEVIRDAVNPQAVGSYGDLKDGTYTSHNVMANQTQVEQVGSETTVSVTTEVYPQFWSEMQRGVGRGQGYAEAPAASGRVAKVKTTSEPCSARPELQCRTGKTTVDTTRRIEFQGAIPVGAEVTVDGEVIRRIELESLVLK